LLSVSRNFSSQPAAWCWLRGPKRFRLRGRGALHADIRDVQGRHHDAEESRQYESARRQSQPELRRRECLAAALLERRAEGTKSFALTMVDPEGRGGLGVFHWVAYGIPANVTSFAEGEVSKTSDKYVGGKSTQGVPNYSGPCTPPGSPHHYTFRIIATDLDPKELAPGMTLPSWKPSLGLLDSPRTQRARPVSSACS